MYIDQVLALREKRFVRQKALILRYGLPLISFTLNIPGGDKYNTIFIKLHDEVMQRISQRIWMQGMEIISEERRVSLLGPECIYIVRGPAQKVKSLMIEEEEHHTLGRLLDLDVFDENLKLISRRDLGYHGRICLLCSQEAIKCILERNHSSEELRKKVVEMVKTYEENNTEWSAKR